MSRGVPPRRPRPDTSDPEPGMGALEWVFWAGVLGVLGLFVYLGIQVSNEPAPKFVSPAACLHHGGIAQVERSAIGITDLVCRDGAYFTVEAG